MASTGTKSSDTDTSATPSKPPKLTGDKEMDALAAVTYHLSQLNPKARERVLTFVADRHGYGLTTLPTTTADGA